MVKSGNVLKCCRKAPKRRFMLADNRSNGLPERTRALVWPKLRFDGHYNAVDMTFPAIKASNIASMTKIWLLGGIKQARYMSPFRTTAYFISFNRPAQKATANDMLL